MGVCCSSTSNHKKKKKLIPSSSSSIISILRKGNTHELKELIMNYNEDINAYSFDSNKTLLITAILECPNAAIVKMIVNKGGDVNMIEKETGNPPLFIAAVDLKINFVNELLLAHVDVKMKNYAKQNVYEFLQFELFVQRKELKMEPLNYNEKDRYDSIVKWIQMAEKGGIDNKKGNDKGNFNVKNGQNAVYGYDNNNYLHQQQQQNIERLDNDYVPRLRDDESEGFN